MASYPSNPVDSVSANFKRNCHVNLKPCGIVTLVMLEYFDFNKWVPWFNF